MPYQVLVVDDSMIIRNKISRLPDSAGYHVIDTAKDGKEAIQKCAQYHPDIVTLDLTMPGMDGLQAIPKLIEIKSNILILVVSALSDQATGLEALELGASGFLNKPFTDEQLLKSLTRMVKYSHKQLKKKK